MKRRETSIFVKIAVFAFAVFAIIMLVQLQLESNELKIAIAEKEKENQALEENIDALENELAGVNDDDYIIDVAKDKLNLRLPEEIIFYNDLYN